ncbi:nitrous oxide reductase accessory protein NosL [Halomarina pelagica]|uniref:nitrous oxide reductase accessory protein NosL n=1 Tax=Halomarina pelagica TaxID=2961599 RepID=UPI0020C5462C|nr:nitrous oxide reductase accessory protein NosL [Halomarina sp. BND7]
MPEHSPPTIDERSATAPVGRRAVLGALGAVGATAIAGCTGAGERPAADVPEPVDLSGGKTDDVGGMVIGEHFGPNGQIFYRDHAPAGRDGPAWFMSLTAGLFPYYFERERRGWEAVAVYVTDYSAIDYSLVSRDGRTYLPSLTAADTFSPARRVTYVAGSAVLGGMGKALVPFSDPADADSFAEEHGGRTVAFEDVTQAWLTDYVRG